MKKANPSPFVALLCASLGLVAGIGSLLHARACLRHPSTLQTVSGTFRSRQVVKLRRKGETVVFRLNESPVAFGIHSDAYERTWTQMMAIDFKRNDRLAFGVLDTDLAKAQDRPDGQGPTRFSDIVWVQSMSHNEVEVFSAGQQALLVATNAFIPGILLTFFCLPVTVFSAFQLAKGRKRKKPLPHAAG